MPEISNIGLSRGSCFTSAWTASSRSAWVLRWMSIAKDQLARSSCAGLTRASISYRNRLLKDGAGSSPAMTSVENSMPPPVFRFAPSPNGYLHLGHAFSALLNFDLARQNGGGLLLRVEDIDVTRCRPEFEAAIHEDLAWLGIAWETPVRRQSEHLADYREALEELSAQGLVYLSFEARAEIAKLVARREASGRWPRDPDGAPLYPGTAKLLSPDKRARLLESDAPYALRLDMAAACARAGNLGWREHGEGPDGEAGAVSARPEAWGDVILARKETPTSYHLSVVV